MMGAAALPRQAFAHGIRGEEGFTPVCAGDGRRQGNVPAVPSMLTERGSNHIYREPAPRLGFVEVFPLFPVFPCNPACPDKPPSPLSISRRCEQRVPSGLIGGRLDFSIPPLGAAKKKFPKLAHVKIWLTVRSCCLVGQRLTPPPPTWRVVTRTDAVPRRGSRPRDRRATGEEGAQVRRRGAGRAGRHTTHPRGRVGRSARSSGTCVRGLLLLAQIFREARPHPVH